jgi:TRAP-type C4-dicarboxylate transport system substrate-binding protein
MKLAVSSRVAVSRIIALAVALSIGAIPTAAMAREFRAADTQIEDYPTVQALLFMGRLISEKSGGRHRIRVFHSRQLGEERETIEQTRAGAIDLNRANVALMGSFVPAMNVLAMPFLFRSIEHLLVTDFDRKPFETAMAGLYAQAQRDPATAELIERIRKVE